MSLPSLFHAQPTYRTAVDLPAEPSLRLVARDPNGDPDYDSGLMLCSYCGPDRRCDCTAEDDAYEIAGDR